jgi:GntR family transcriptional repressor for pyruvate dehydrogenase complex
MSDSDMENIFSEIRPQKIPQEIVGQIKSLIKEGRLQPGQKLPSERALAHMLGVGRSSLREAINILDTLGFIEIRKRKGIYVTSVSSHIMSDPLRHILEEEKGRLVELYELRKDIELASTYMAAKRWIDADLAAIEKPLQRMEQDAHHARLTTSDDLRFHLAIAQASRNFLRVHVLKNIFDLSRDYIELVGQTLARNRSNITIILEQHTDLLRAIRNRDQEHARDIMDRHLTWVEDQWQQTAPGPTWKGREAD